MGVLPRHIVISVVAAGMLLCAGLFADVSVSDDAEFVNVLSVAKAAQKKAGSVGGEWRDVAKFIKEAEQAAADGDFDQAKKLAQKARAQSELGYEQAVSQKGKAGNPSYLR